MRARTIRSPALRFAAAVLAMVGCANQLEAEWQLTRFRILGVELDHPEAHRADSATGRPGDMVTARLVYANPQSQSVSILWQVCTSRSATNPCLGSVIPPMGGERISFRIPENITTLDDDGRPIISIFGVVCAGGEIRLPNSSNPMPSCAPEDTAVGFYFTRSIQIVPDRPPHPPNEPNQNPVLVALRFNSQEISEALPPSVPRCANNREGVVRPNCPRYAIELTFGPQSREHYWRFDPSRPAGQQIRRDTEEMEVIYFVDHGGWLAGAERGDNSSFPWSRMRNEFIAPATGDVVNLYVTVFDGRGGFTWARRQIRLTD